MFGSTTTFVRGTWPPRSINLRWDGGPKGEGGIRVEGRAVSRHSNGPHLSVRVEPDDKSLLGCEVHAPTNGWQ